MRARRLAAPFAVAVCSLAAAGCGDSAYVGSWEVIDFRRPGITMMGDMEAGMWLGSTLEVTRETATMAGESCAVGGVRRETLPVRSVEMGHGLAPGELGISKESVDLIEFECTEGQLGPGRELIRIARDSVLMPWEGVFFVLERKR